MSKKYSQNIVLSVLLLFSLNILAQIDPTLLQPPYTLTQAQGYQESGKAPEALWVAIHLIAEQPDAVRKLAQQIKGTLPDSSFVKAIENAFWTYAPKINVMADPTSDKPVISFNQRLLWKNEITAMVTEKGDAANLYDQKARDAARKRDFFEALKYYKKAVETVPTAWRYYQLGEYQSDNDLIRESIESYSKAIDLQFYIPFYYKRANIYQYIGEYNNAINDYTVVIEHQYSFFLYKAYFYRGVCYGLIKSWDKALTSFNNAIKINQSADLYIGRGALYSEGFGEFNKAISDIQKGIELEPKNPKGYHTLGMVYFRMKKYKKAIKEYKKALEYNPNNKDDIFSDIGIAYYNKGNQKEACKVWKKAAEKSYKQCEYYLDKYCD